MSRPLSFIGFSGCGKSHLAGRLATDLSFNHIECDRLIENSLEQVLPKSAPGTLRLASWLGQPYDSGYAERAQQYLEAEQETLTSTLDSLARDSESDRPTVIDTSGSVIYCDSDLLLRLRELTTVVYLQISLADEEKMFALYRSDPKPLIWHTAYKPLGQEKPEETLRRCYPLLLAQRTSAYEKLAHVIVPFNYAIRSSVRPEDVLKAVARLAPNCSPVT